MGRGQRRSSTRLLCLVLFCFPASSCGLHAALLTSSDLSRDKNFLILNHPESMYMVYEGHGGEEDCVRAASQAGGLGALVWEVCCNTVLIIRVLAICLINPPSLRLRRQRVVFSLFRLVPESGSIGDYLFKYRCYNICSNWQPWTSLAWTRSIPSSVVSFEAVLNLKQKETYWISDKDKCSWIQTFGAPRLCRWEEI